MKKGDCEGLKIVGMFGICKGERDLWGVPEKMNIAGYITNKGDLYAIYTKSIFSSSEYLTKEELIRKIKVYLRKQKLEKLSEL